MDKMKHIILIAVMACIVNVQAQEFRFAQDRPFTSDKLAHATGSGLLYLGLLRATQNNQLSVMITVAGGVLWEVKDGFVRWEDYGWWGGDGFSLLDIVADLSGIVVAQLILSVFDAPIYLQVTGRGVRMSVAL